MHRFQNQPLLSIQLLLCVTRKSVFIACTFALIGSSLIVGTFSGCSPSRADRARERLRDVLPHRLDNEELRRHAVTVVEGCSRGEPNVWSGSTHDGVASFLSDLGFRPWGMLVQCNGSETAVVYQWGGGFGHFGIIITTNSDTDVSCMPHYKLERIMPNVWFWDEG
jgi:hypothetical protein